MSYMETTRAYLAEMIAYPTVSTDSNLQLIAWLAERLEHAGARCEIFLDPTGTKGNLFATIGPEGDGGIVLSGHTDVVPVADQLWSSDPFAMEERAGRLYGRGTCDMKGFIAASLAMAPLYAAQDARRPLHFAFTHDEEVGCVGGAALAAALRDRGLKPSLAIIGEPTEMRIIEGHKGCCEYTTRFAGLEGHGSSPDRGVNAVEYAVRYITRLMALRERLKDRAPAGSRFDPPWTTINTGALNGGHAHNVIPGLAEVAWEMRPVRWEDADFVKADLSAYVNDELLPAMRAVCPEAAIETEVIGEVAGLEPMEQNAARDLVAELTGFNGAETVPFGTEAGLFQALGMSVVVCGPGAIAQAHKPDEFVDLGQMSLCLDMLEKLAPKLTRAPA